VSATIAEPPPAGVTAIDSTSAPPEGSDGEPRVTLASRKSDGSLAALGGEYLHAVSFRRGMAAVTVARELELVRPDGSRSVLARELDGLPSAAADGSLVYAARSAEFVELYRLTAAGSIDRVASFRGTATRLAPQSDGSIVFTGAVHGGVVGVWIADDGGTRCLTNCALRAGEPWGDGYRAPPGDVDKVRISGATVQWQAADGSWDAEPLNVEARP